MTKRIKKIKVRVWINKFIVRLKTCWHILSRKYDHWIIIYLDDEALRSLLASKDYDCQATSHGLHRYVTLKLLRQVAEVKDDNDMILEKAAFEGEAEEKYKQD